MKCESVEMKGLRQMLRVSWTKKKINEWIMKKAGVDRLFGKREKTKVVPFWTSHTETIIQYRKRNHIRNNARTSKSRTTKIVVDR